MCKRYLGMIAFILVISTGCVITQQEQNLDLSLSPASALRVGNCSSYACLRCDQDNRCTTCANGYNNNYGNCQFCNTGNCYQCDAYGQCYNCNRGFKLTSWDACVPDTDPWIAMIVMGSITVAFLIVVLIFYIIRKQREGVDAEDNYANHAISSGH